MVVLAHAADYFMFMPVLLFVLVISIKSLIAQRRERRDQKEPKSE